MQNDNRPVDLLSDPKGIYGIGIAHDELSKGERECYPHLIFRRDVLAQSAFPSELREALLHAVPKRCFMMTYEWELHKFMLNEALKRNPRYQELAEEVEAAKQGEEVWRKSERGKLYRKIRWGEHRRQLFNLNGMLKRLIAEAAEPDALRLARRFHPVVRENIYRGAAISQRALQLIDAFPVLGVVVYCRLDGWWDRAPDAAQMVERGVRLNQIASFMEIPMWARKLKPAIADWLCDLPDDVHYYIPEKTW